MEVSGFAPQFGIIWKKCNSFLIFYASRSKIQLWGFLCFRHMCDFKQLPLILYSKNCLSNQFPSVPFSSGISPAEKSVQSKTSDTFFFAFKKINFKTPSKLENNP